MQLVINVLNLNGIVEKNHHIIRLKNIEDVAEVEVLAQEWANRLNSERWLNWEIELVDERNMVQHTWDMDSNDSRPIFYMLTQEGYAWNSEVRDNIDIIAKRIYDIANNA